MLTIFTGFLLGFFLSLIMIFLLLHKKDPALASSSKKRAFLSFYRRLRWPAIISFLLYINYTILFTLPLWLDLPFISPTLYAVVVDLNAALLLLALYSLSSSTITTISNTLCDLTQHKTSWLTALIPLLAKGIKIVAALVLLNVAIKLLGMPPEWSSTVKKLSRVLVIGMIGWLLLQLIHTTEAIFIQYNQSKLANTLDSRKTYTHISIIKRIIITLLTILIVAAMLMNFESIRTVGATALASAGVFATIVGFSAKGLLESIFKGLQIAITQPIRVNDTILIEGESGTVDSISLHHVVVTLWDKKQIIVPTGYFLDKSFQNWTRHSNELSGHIFFYVNYNMPIEPIREKFYELLKGNALWNKKSSGFYVHDFKNRMVELRLIVSANDSNSLGKLRYFIREELLAYMQKSHSTGLPQYLPNGEGF
jgi:small-conductance mechanosensitive channel